MSEAKESQPKCDCGRPIAGHCYGCGRDLCVYCWLKCRRTPQCTPTPDPLRSQYRKGEQ